MFKQGDRIKVVKVSEEAKALYRQFFETDHVPPDKSVGQEGTVLMVKGDKTMVSLDNYPEKSPGLPQVYFNGELELV